MSSQPPSNKPLGFPRQRFSSAADALASIRSVLFASAILVGIYAGREFLIPLALAALITFLLTPLVNRMGRWVGNVVSVIAAMLMVIGVVVSAGWMLGNQAMDLAERLPSYKENIRTKMKVFNVPEGGVLSRLTETVEDLKKDLPGRDKGPDKTGDTPEPMPVAVVEGGDSKPMDTVRAMVSQVAGPLGTTALVLLLTTFMLLKREDLRSRLLRLIGQGNISTTTKALDEAGTKVRKYLLMQLVVNVTYGIPLAIGLGLIGVPNAILWGAVATVLRFVPYIGPWIAASFPIMLSLAVSPDWVAPLLTMGLFVTLELISNNVIEPWLYGASTGVSPVALIVSAVYWTWVWGTAGLVLSTPFTVCLVVMGRHIPQLSFLSVLFGEEEALTPAEDCYQRLLRRGEHDETEFADAFLRSHPLVELYDAVLLPVVISAERDLLAASIDGEQRDQIVRALSRLVEDLGERPLPSPEEEADDPPRAGDCRVRILATRAERDEIAGAMASQVLERQGFDSRQLPAQRVTGELIQSLREDEPDLVCLSVIAPTKAAHARLLCTKIRKAFPNARIVVGMWGAAEPEVEDHAATLREAGADDIVTSIAALGARVESLERSLADEVVPPPVPADEEQRLKEVERLGLMNGESEPLLDHVTEKLARVFEVPMTAITLVDHERQWFKAHVGLPGTLAELRETPRDLSICGHVVGANRTVVVRDMKRDRRFAKNPMLVTHHVRAYAGAPIRTADGQPVGALCLMDLEPRDFTDREIRLLEANAAELAGELERMAEGGRGT